MKTKATVEDLYHIPENGKAELVRGEIVRMAPTGGFHNIAGGNIFASLRQYAKTTKKGRAFTDNIGFAINLSNRQSFSPDASFQIGYIPGIKFPTGAPTFAAEIRSEGNYGPSAEREMAEKRADYFAAGTVVVWDVDLQSEETICSYRASDPETPVVFRRGEIADAEPALPGWRMPVDDLYE